jgi:hypothetical protein
VELVDVILRPAASAIVDIPLGVEEAVVRMEPP